MFHHSQLEQICYVDKHILLVAVLHVDIAGLCINATGKLAFYLQ